MKTLHSYLHKPSPKFVGKARTKRFFGVEIECYPARRYSCEAFNESMNLLAEWERSKGFGEDEFAYCKRDGSLHEGHGIEIVTHPFSFFQMRTKKLFDGLENCKLSSYRLQSTGIHVHVGREGLSKATIAKMVYMFSLPEFDRVITTVAQREWNGYCRKPRKGNMRGNLGQYASRYNAINLRNTHTIEFRMFKGNVNPEAVYRAVEFVYAVTNYCAKTSATRINPDTFVSYILNAKQDKRNYKYPHLRKFVKKELR